MHPVQGTHWEGCESVHPECKKKLDDARDAVERGLARQIETLGMQYMRSERVGGTDDSPIFKVWFEAAIAKEGE